MTKLTPTQSDLLNTVARAVGDSIDAPDGAKAAVAALIKRGFLTCAPQPVGPNRLRVTDAGRAAVGLDASQDTPTAKGKIATLLGLLRQPDGTTVEAMMAATGWQAHSVRGAMSGAIKKNLGLAVTSQKTEAGRIYRIPAEVQA